MPSRSQTFAKSSRPSLGRGILKLSARSLQIKAGHLGATLLLLFAGGGCSTPPVTSTAIQGEPTVIDQLYPPATGPASSQQFTLLKEYPRQVWLTGVEIAVKDVKDANKNAKDGKSVEGVLSATTVGFQDVERHRQLNHLSGQLSPSIFHPGPGLTSLTLPKGYGIPLQSNEILYISAIWQNRDLYRPPLEARLDATLKFHHHEPDLPPTKELRVYPVFATVPGTPTGSPKPYDLRQLQLDGQGKAASARWWIPSGPSTVRSLVSYQLPPEQEVTVRYLSAFVYDDWTELELVDLTSGVSLVKFAPGSSQAREMTPPLTLDSRHRLELKVSYKNPAASDHVGAGMLVLYADPPKP